jgi:hypothetical protein
MKARVAALFVACLFLAAGCGGGNDGPSATRAQMDVSWPDRSREAAPAPSSALSAVLTLVNAAPNGSDFTFTMNRDATLTAHTQSYTATTDAMTGLWSYTLRFHAQKDAGGSVTSEITGRQARLHANGTLTNPDGSALTFGTVTGKIATVVLLPRQSVIVGTPRDLVFEARDAAGQPIAVTHGSASWTVDTAGQAFLQIADGQATGLVPGTAKVAVTVDGKTSEVVPVDVASLTVVSDIIMRDDGNGTLVQTVRNKWQANVGGGRVLEAHLFRVADHPYSPIATPVAVGSFFSPGEIYDIPAPGSYWDGIRGFLESGGGQSTVVTPVAGAVVGFTPGQTYQYQVTLLVRYQRGDGGGNGGGNGGGGGGTIEDVTVGPVTGGPVTP